MADVHLARMRGPAGFDKLVVLKRIRQQLADDPEVLRMFLDEARIAARLAHPNVVQTYEVGRDGQQYFLAMEYLDGQPLSRVRTRFQELGGLPLALHLRVLADVLEGLHYAHELADYDGSPLGLVHRDVTPQNVFVTYAGGVKIVDFGIAKAKCSTVETRAGTFKGKVTYIPREQAMGEPVDRRADIFAVGVMLWEAVTGERPWTGLDQAAILQRIVAGRFPPVRAACPAVSDELAAIVDKALAPAREDRYATAADFQAAIEGYLERCGETAHPRDLSRLLKRNFAAERIALSALLEEQVRAGPQEKTVRRAALPHVEERSTVPEPAVVRSRTGLSFQTPNGNSLSAIESPLPTPEPPHPRRRRVLVSVGPLALALIMAAIVRSLPARSLPAATAISAAAASPVAASAPALLEAAPRVAEIGDQAAAFAADAGAPSAVAASHRAPARPAPRLRRVDERNPYVPR
jgi:eukaryotic-like serine/threonine-protein kinase